MAINFPSNPLLNDEINLDGVLYRFDGVAWIAQPFDSTVFAPATKGVTNGDSHDHSNGDGAQISYTSLSNLPTFGPINQITALLNGAF